MSEESEPIRCELCGFDQEYVRYLLDLDGHPVCDACTRRLQRLLDERLEEISMAQAAVSPVAEAEELVLGLFDRLETTRAHAAEGGLTAKRLQEEEERLRVVDEEGYPFTATDAPPTPPAPPRPPEAALPADLDDSMADSMGADEPPHLPLEEGFEEDFEDDFEDDLDAPEDQPASDDEASDDPAVFETSARGGEASTARSDVSEEPWTSPVAVIPARYSSTRFPGKPLALLQGKPMIQHVVERCLESGAFGRVVVATDDERIAEAVRSFGGEVALTSQHCRSGSDRVAELAQAHPEVERWINVQGDEPTVHPDALSSLVTTLEDPEVSIATLVRPLEEQERADPAVVKVVLGRNNDALYFSRADIPHAREPDGPTPAPRYAHLGLYAFRREALLAFSRLAASPLEETEQLEQLRALECGTSIRCTLTLHTSRGIDTPEQLEALARTLQDRS